MTARPLAVLALVLIALLLRVPTADAQEPVTIVIEGPTAIAPSSTHAYTVTVTGGPAAVNGTFEIRYLLQGENLVGGDPLIERILANKEGKFTANVTAPEVEGAVTLFVRAKSGSLTENVTAETSLSIDVFRPVELRATIRNSGAAAAINVTVFFEVDGRPVGNMTIARIEAGGTAEANISFVPTGLAEGRHVVTIKADLDRDGVFEAGELIHQDFFYKSAPSNLPAILGTVTVFLIMILVFVLLAVRRQRRQG